MTGERHRAELLLEGSEKSRDDAEALHLPSVADRIRQARLRAALSKNEIASRLGMTVHSYFDLELHDDEVFSVISLKELAELGGILGVPPRVILLGCDGEGNKQTVTFEDVTAHIVKKISESGLTADQLGDLVGWDITMEHYNVLNDPQSLWSYTVQGLYDICRAVGLDWVAALPDAGNGS